MWSADELEVESIVSGSISQITTVRDEDAGLDTKAVIDTISAALSKESSGDDKRYFERYSNNGAKVKASFEFNGTDLVLPGGDIVRADVTGTLVVESGGDSSGVANAGGVRQVMLTLAVYVDIIPIKDKKTGDLVLHPTVTLSYAESSLSHPLMVLLATYTAAQFTKDNAWASVLATSVNRGKNPGVLNTLLRGRDGAPLGAIDLLDSSLTTDAITRELVGMITGEPMVRVESRPSSVGLATDLYEEAFASPRDMTDAIYDMLSTISGKDIIPHPGSVIVQDSIDRFDGVLLGNKNEEESLSNLDLIAVMEKAFNSKDADEIINSYIRFLVGSADEVQKMKVIRVLGMDCHLRSRVNDLYLDPDYIDDLIASVDASILQPVIDTEIGNQGYGGFSDTQRFKSALLSSSVYRGRLNYDSRRGSDDRRHRYDTERRRYR